MDPSRIEPGQRYAWCTTAPAGPWMVSDKGEDDSIPHGEYGIFEFYPIVEPERLHEVKVGSTVLNVATNERFEWDHSHQYVFRRGNGVHNLTPLLALVALPDTEDTND